MLKECPNCGKPAMSLLNKLVRSRLDGNPCENCGATVVLPRWAGIGALAVMVVGVIVVAAVEMFDEWVGAVVIMLIIVALFAFAPLRTARTS